MIDPVFHCVGLLVRHDLDGAQAYRQVHHALRGQGKAQQPDQHQRALGGPEDQRNAYGPGDDGHREAFVIDAEEFIGAKTFKAKGRRATNWQVDTITELEPREPEHAEGPAPDPVDPPSDDAVTEPQETPTVPTPSTEGISQDEVLDKFTGQQRIPFDE